MIDIAKVNLALNYYQMMGYSRIEVPWMVPTEIAELTSSVGFDIVEDYSTEVMRSVS